MDAEQTLTNRRVDLLLEDTKKFSPHSVPDLYTCLSAWLNRLEFYDTPDTGHEKHDERPRAD